MTDRATIYSSRHEGLVLGDRLGLGTDGLIIATTRHSAIKIFERLSGYLTERDVYLRLQEQNVRTIQGFAVPQLLGFDDNLKIVEMSIVTPPFVLDFAKCDLDWPTEFPDEVMEEWRRQKMEEFEHHWPTVCAIMSEFENRLGVYLRDVHPRNIRFVDQG